MNVLLAIDDSRFSEAILRWKIGSTKEWFTLRSHEHCQGPAAPLPHHLDNLLIDFIDIRPLLAIHLNVDKPFVQQLSDFRVLE